MCLSGRCHAKTWPFQKYKVPFFVLSVLIYVSNAVPITEILIHPKWEENRESFSFSTACLIISS